MDARPNEKPPGLLARLLDSAVQWMAAVIVAGALFLAGKYYLFDRLDDEICTRCESLLRERYPGLNVSVSSARRMEGKGIEIHGVTIREGGNENAPVILNVERIFAECETQLPEMLTQAPKVRKLQIRGVRMRAERKPSGVWNVSHLLPLPAGDGPPCSITIDDAAIEVVDPTRQAALNLRDIHLAVDPDRAAGADQAVRYRVVGHGAGDHFDRLELEGKFARGGGEWSLSGAVEGLEFTPRLRAALPTDCDRWLKPLASVRGRTRLKFDASNSPANPAGGLQFKIAGNVSEGRIDDNRLPEPLTDVAADIEADNRGLRIGALTARCGPAAVAGTLVISGFTAASPIDLSVNLRGWPLERQPRDLSPQVETELRKLNLRGTADISGRFTFDGAAWHRSVEATCRRVSIQHESFPYPLTDGEGRLIDDGKAIHAELRALAGTQPVTIVAEFPMGKTAAAGRVDIRTEKPIPIDDRLLAALDPNAQKIVRAFQPRGTISVVGRIDRGDPNLPPQKTWRIELHDLAVRYEKFPYPFFNVRGTVEYVDGEWTFNNLTGRNDSGYVTGEGSLTKDKAGSPRLALTFKATDVPLDEDLRRSLNTGSQRLWNMLQPRGNLDQLTVNIGYRAGDPNSFTLAMQGQKWQPRQNVEGRGITLAPTLLPYRLDNVTGAFRYENGEITLSNVQASHGRTTLATQGFCRPNGNGGWSLSFDRVAIDRLQIDHELLQALPRDLAAGALRIDLRGPVGIAGRIGLELSQDERDSFSADWDLAVDIENGQCVAGVPFEHLFGGVRLVGRGGPQGFVSRGQLQLDSFVAKGIQVSNIRGPILIDSKRVVLGEWAGPMSAERGPQPVTANVFGGKLNFDGGLEFNEEGRFAVQTVLDDANLWNIMLEAMPKHSGITGKAYGTLSMQGSTKGRHTWRGNGAVRLRDADIFELPVMFAMLKQLSIRRQDSVPFSDSNMDFRIEGEDLQFDRLDFHGEVVSLKGRGRVTMTEQRPVDLQFYTQVGRDEMQLPLLRPLLGEASRSFLLIEVTGTAENPLVTKKAFPAINEQLRQLFPELGSDPHPNAPKAAPATTLFRRR